MRPLQVSFNFRQMVRFAIVDPEVLETLRLVHSRIPQAGPAPATPHALVASLLGHCVSLAAEGSPISAVFPAELARHVPHQRAIIDKLPPPDLPNAGAAFQAPLAQNASARPGRQGARPPPAP